MTSLARATAPSAAAATSESATAHWLHHFFAGWVAGSVACTLLSPLEVIKTRQQSSVSRGGNYVRADALAVRIVRAEGLRGLYRGLLPHLMGVGPSRAFYFGGYALFKARLGGDGRAPPLLAGVPLHLTASALASVVSSTIMSPVWVVKTRLQLQGAVAEGAAGAAAAVPRVGAGAAAAAGAGAPSATPAVSLLPRYSGVLDCFAKVYAREGPWAFYRGLTASYLGVIETSLQFTLYGALKTAVTARRLDAMRASAAAGTGPPLPRDAADAKRAAYSDGVAFCTSAASKLVAATLTYPHEVLRTRMREGSVALAPPAHAGAPAPPTPRYVSIVQSVRLILAEEGLRGLYGGMGVHLLRTVPNAAILLMVVEKAVGGEV